MPTAPDLDALFAAVSADPDDEGARRVLADRLLEAGDPHGEHIQLSCEAAALPPGDPRREALAAQAATLRRRHGLAFSRRLRAVPFFDASPEGAWTPRFDFDRGFPDQVRGQGKALVAALPAAAKASPVRGVHLLDATPADVRALADLPELGRVRVLSIRSLGKLDDAIGRLLGSPHLRRLERLDLDCPLAASDLEALAACPAVDGLRELGLSHPIGESPSVDALLRSPRLAGLVDLRIWNYPVTAETVVGLRALTHLDLGSVALGAAGAARFAKDLPPGLRVLRLSDCDLGQKGAPALASSPALAALETLALDRMITGKHLPAFLDALALPALRSLGFDGSILRADGARALATRSGKLAGLRKLSLIGAGIKDEGAKALAGVSLPALTELDLGGNGIGPEGMEALAGGPLLGSVRSLSIRHNKCGSDGALALARAPSLARLTKLGLFYNWMGVKGVRALLAAAPALTELHAGENNYGAAPSRFLAASKDHRSLRVLSLREADVGPFAKSEAARGLEVLWLENSVIDAEAARALAALPELERLHLSFATVDDEVRRILRGRFGPNLSVFGGFDEWKEVPGPG